jgi:polysaccharide export outer membrane protein
VDARYLATIPGVDVTPVLTQRAPRFVYVLGEVKQPNRYTLDGPTTLMGALAMAGGWNLGANTRQVVVFRRGDDWRMMATMLDINGALYGRRPAPADEIWINDSDIIVVPKTPIHVANEFIAQFFSQGLYSMFPQFAFGNFSFSNFRNIAN